MRRRRPRVRSTCRTVRRSRFLKPRTGHTRSFGPPRRGRWGRICVDRCNTFLAWDRRCHRAAEHPSTPGHQRLPQHSSRSGCRSTVERSARCHTARLLAPTANTAAREDLCMRKPGRIRSCRPADMHCPPGSGPHKTRRCHSARPSCSTYSDIAHPDRRGRHWRMHQDRLCKQWERCACTDRRKTLLGGCTRSSRSWRTWRYCWARSGRPGKATSLGPCTCSRRRTV